MKKALMIMAIVAILAIAGSMIYYFVFFKPGIEKEVLMLQEEKLQHEKDILTQEAIDKASKEQQNKETELTKIQIVEPTTEIQETTIEYYNLVGIDKQHNSYNLDGNNVITGNINALVIAVIIKNYGNTPIVIRWVCNGVEYFKSSEFQHPSEDYYVSSVGAGNGTISKGKWQCLALMDNINQILIEFEVK